MQEKNDRVFLCLGNYGDEYNHTVHNIGMAFFDYLFQEGLIKTVVEDKNAHICKDKEGILFIKLKGCINLTGINFAKLKLKEAKLAVVYDDINLDRYVVKFSFGVGTAGHNGIKNIESIKGKEFIRIRIGVGRPPSGMTVNEFVLSKIKPIAIEKYLFIFQTIFEEREMLFMQNASGLYKRLKACEPI